MTETIIQSLIGEFLEGRIYPDPKGRDEWPEISRFYGLVILMYYNDHEPAHFHVRY